MEINKYRGSPPPGIRAEIPSHFHHTGRSVTYNGLAMRSDNDP